MMMMMWPLNVSSCFRRAKLVDHLETFSRLASPEERWWRRSGRRVRKATRVLQRSKRIKKEIKDLLNGQKRNHTPLWDNADASTLSARDAFPCTPVAIFPSTQVFTILSKQLCVQKQQYYKRIPPEIVTGRRAINACVARRGTNGLRLSTQTAFYGAFVLWNVQMFATREVSSKHTGFSFALCV